MHRVIARVSYLNLEIDIKICGKKKKGMLVKVMPRK